MADTNEVNSEEKESIGLNRKIQDSLEGTIESSKEALDGNFVDSRAEKSVNAKDSMDSEINENTSSYIVRKVSYSKMPQTIYCRFYRSAKNFIYTTYFSTI